MGKFVVVTYKPKVDKDQQLLDAIREHLEVLRSQQMFAESDSIEM